MKYLIALITGGLFGAGLGLSGMSDRAKVLGFLDITGNWDPSLGFVMAAALLVSVPFYWLAKKKTQPLFDKQFFIPTRNDFDIKLIAGSSLFGLGWGLYGFCPGPAFVSLTYLKDENFMFFIAMVVGMFISKFVQKKLS